MPVVGAYDLDPILGEHRRAHRKRARIHTAGQRRASVVSEEVRTVAGPECVGGRGDPHARRHRADGHDKPGVGRLLQRGHRVNEVRPIIVDVHDVEVLQVVQQHVVQDVIEPRVGIRVDRNRCERVAVTGHKRLPKRTLRGVVDQTIRVGVQSIARAEILNFDTVVL